MDCWFVAGSHGPRHTNARSAYAGLTHHTIVFSSFEQAVGWTGIQVIDGKSIATWIEHRTSGHCQCVFVKILGVWH